MKRIILAMIIFVCSFAMNMHANTYIEDNAKTSIIEQINVNVPSRILIYSGEDFGINIRTKNEDIYDLIKYKVKDGILYIDIDDYRYVIDQKIDSEDIRINIQTPYDIKKIKTNSDLLVASIQKHKATNDGNN